MKIRITDLLDTYYDGSVKLDDPISLETPQTFSPHKVEKKKYFSMQKPLLIAASLMLVLCGAFALGLGLSQNDAGTALSDGDPMSTASEALPSDWSIEEEVPAEPETLYPEETTSELEPAEDAETENTTETTAMAENEHIVYVATLDIPIEPDDGLLTDYGDYITKLEIDPVDETFTWYYHLPALEALRWEVYPDGTYDGKNEEFYEKEFDWLCYLAENYWSEALLKYEDGTSFILYGGEAHGFTDSEFWEEGPFDIKEAEFGITIGDSIPVSVTINGVTYAFEETTKVDEEESEATDNRTDSVNVFSEYGMSITELTLFATEAGKDNPSTHFTTEDKNFSFAFEAACEPTDEEKAVTVTYTVLDSAGNELMTYAAEQIWPGDQTSLQFSADLPDLIDIPGQYMLMIYFNEYGSAGQTFVVTEPNISYAAAEDTNGDGMLTAILNEDVTNGPLTGSIVKFEIDLSKGCCIWYTLNDELDTLNAEYEAGNITWDEYSDLSLNWTNFLLDEYYGPARIVFTDGCERNLGCGDRIIYEDGLRQEDFYLDLGDIDTDSNKGYSPAYLIFNGQQYEFE